MAAFGRGVGGWLYTTRLHLPYTAANSHTNIVVLRDWCSPRRRCEFARKAASGHPSPSIQSATGAGQLDRRRSPHRPRLILRHRRRSLSSSNEPIHPHPTSLQRFTNNRKTCFDAAGRRAKSESTSQAANLPVRSKNREAARGPAAGARGEGRYPARARSPANPAARKQPASTQLMSRWTASHAQTLPSSEIGYPAWVD